MDDTVWDLMRVEALDWVRAGTVLLLAVVVAWVLRRAVRRWLHRGSCEVGAAELIARFVGYGTVLLGVVYALMALGVQIGPLLGALGVGGLAVALAAKSLLEDLFGGFVLQARHPFRRGDEIAVGTHRGRVEDINLRAVVLRTHDGERLFLPSSMVLQDAIVNLTAEGARRSTVEVFLPHGADRVQVLDALRAAVGRLDAVRRDPAPLVEVRALGERGIEVAVKVWHAPTVADEHRAVDQTTQAALDALEACGVRPEVPQRHLVTTGGAFA